MKINELQITVKARFKIYEHVICNNKRELWQLEFCKNNKTRYLRKLTFNKERKAYRINSQWVSKKRLLKLLIVCNERIELRKHEIKIYNKNATP